MSIIPSKTLIDAIVTGEHGDPFAVLGMHPAGPGGTWVVRAFLPSVDRVQVLHHDTGAVAGDLERIHPEGLFAGALDSQYRERFAYRLRVTRDGHTWDMDDPYGFLTVLGDLDVHLMGEGAHLRPYEKLGSHLTELGGVSGATFAVWAPNAKRVAVVGDFNDWDGRRHPMRLRGGVGIWEIFIPAVGPGAKYKFEVKDANGARLPLKMDPYSFATEMRPQTASLVYAENDYSWGDDEWLIGRKRHSHRRAPITIYEVHLGSWKRVAGQGDRFMTYRELAEELIPYVRDIGFTHIELLPISEHPFDGSWGYQPIGLYAPTSRFGSPSDFKYFVDRCHQAGIGVLLDWVPAHFPSDPHGLGRFDGTALYEHADPRQGFHHDWNTLIYNFGRREVANFLLGNALFWLERYHIDGLRVDAVASMLYLDYSRREGEWIPNQYGGRENLEAIGLLRRMNELAYTELSGAITVAEESTAWPAVTLPVYLGGLGFGFKWNMGWMHDSLRYIARDPIHRRYHHNELTFSLVYAFNENFVLSLSHDEVVHGKGSILARMPGDAWRQFANLRAYYGFMWTHPGKKLLFMGCEFAQGREWNHDAGLDWHLLDISWHVGVQRLVRDLNRLYRTLPALYERDSEAEGFRWIQADDSENSVVAFLRQGGPDTLPVVVVCNLTPNVRAAYQLGVPGLGFYAELLNTDAEYYGGSNVGNRGGVRAEPEPWLGQPCSLFVTLPPLSTVVFQRRVEDEPEAPPKA
ncbi:MAG: 1,4-alpha-glucan branching protein GlgB [Gammaproteobacteria bacterium]|nr:1,4-alpha-glucan branching protein GlgB [Gammaproteobacteria bacterium]MCP5425646.1 1,4-alpha-glucan branching protein GlgB [Gammaproteobacteria bacterium]MCP5458956.1 1,4-alpha-glucan branching protein GlgB [Gammaproteobacteria bacterium]